ncbi:MAG TPA: lysophospholipid acyltransferase family protein [Thermoanaerobaculia bacterium]|nr:lysophospholipid acyltransferase family protein [Thermoanaerobaculia bacterium]
MKNAPVRHFAEYALYLALKGAVRALPHGAARRLGAGLGALAWGLDRRRREIAAGNLAIAFPDLDDRERRRLVGRCFRHFGALFTDTLSAGRFDAVELCRHLTLEGWHNLDAAEQAGRGVLIMGAHLGDWEITNHPIPLYRGPMHVVHRPPDNPWLDRELRRFRDRFGNRPIDKRRAARGMLRVLRDRGRVAILIDQRVRDGEGIRVPFFGRPALTTPALARLSLHTGAPVVPMFGFFRAGGRYRVRLEPPIWPEGRGDDAVAALTARYLAVVEEEIRARPAEWLWLHDRWKE